MTEIAPSATSSGEPRPGAIRVVVGYPWTKNREDRVVAARSDKRWQSIRNYANSVGDWVKTTLAKRSPSPVPFALEIARLRGTHGRMLLDDLRIRILEADILIMDIGSSDGKDFNPNVILETGMALAKETGSLRDLFILKPAGGPKLTTLSTPSDLQGFLFTDYRLKSDDRSIEIIDALGFRAALRSAIHRKAKEHNMVGSRLEAYVGPEDGDEDDPGNTKPPKSGPNAGDEARTTGKKPAKRKVEERT